MRPYVTPFAIIGGGAFSWAGARKPEKVNISKKSGAKAQTKAQTRKKSVLKLVHVKPEKAVKPSGRGYY